MINRFISILGGFAAILMVASFVVPMNIAVPSPVAADPGIMKWDTVSTPWSVSGKNDILNWHGPDAGIDWYALANWPFDQTGYGNEILDMAVGNDGMSVVWVARTFLDPTTGGVVALNCPQGAVNAWASSIGEYRNMLYYSNNSGISASVTRVLSLVQHPLAPGGLNAFQVAIAPDDSKVWIVTTDQGVVVPAPGTGAVQPPAANPGPRHIWITMDAGATWDLAFDGTVNLIANETIRCIDISVDYGGKRDIGFGTTAAGGGRWVVRSSLGFTAWQGQTNPNGVAAVALGVAPASALYYYDLKFSPTYSGDSSVALVYANAAAGGPEQANATSFNVAFRDLQMNLTPITASGYAYGFVGVEVKNTAALAGDSPDINNLNTACLQLPSDFSGQSASLRRAYISLDAYNGGAAKVAANRDGIFRVDDTVIYELMDTFTTPEKAIYSIAYFGTYASGKLLAGERMGFPCTATVPTWFTDSPTTCPVPCWYPALKPTTGAANQAVCAANNHAGDGAALVGWNADGSLGLVSTGSLPYTVYAGAPGLLTTGAANAPAPPVGVAAIVASAAAPLNWWQQQYWNAITNDESAFAISRNNGETWNQIALIDTTIDWFNDVAVAPDCTTAYLASVNRNTAAAAFCNEFDSVWRATINPNVAAPLPAVPPLGTYWERVFTHVTEINCTSAAQTDLPILRVVNSCTDKKDGEIVGWAAQGSRAMAWSPDFGDYWANLTPRSAVQDFAFESSTTIYVLSRLGMVQRLPYTGTSWSTNLASAFTNLDLAHTIVAVPDGKVLVGSAAGSQYPVAYSADKGVTFGQSGALAGHGNNHVIFDVDFKNNSFVYMADDTLVVNGLGSVYRNTAPSWSRWSDNDMMQVTNGATGIAWPAGTVRPPHIRGQFGLVQAWTGGDQPALYSAHNVINGSRWTAATPVVNSAVCRTLKPREGMPKPGISWDCLDIFTPLTTSGVSFTLEPSSLKYCGCCTLDTNTTLYAIDDERGAVIGTVAPLTGRWWRPGAPVVGVFGYDAAIGSVAAGYAPFLGQQPVPFPLWGSGPQGMLWAYTDCLAKKGPILKAPADQFLVGADPVTGRNQQIDFSWEQLCLTTVYELQIAKDKAMTMRINPAVSNAANIAAVTGQIQFTMDATNMTSPAAWIAPGALPEAGAIYWWRIRAFQSATQQLARSPWSEKRSFTVKAGFIVNTPYYGVQLLAPNNGCIGCKVKPASFSWSPWKEATKYQFDLAKDPEFKTLVVTATTTTTTGYEYSGTLDYSTNYFWRVKALEVNGLEIPSDWSATFSMQTESAPAPPAPPPAEPATPVWVWVIIAIGAILVIVTLVLIFKTRRV